MSDPQQPGNWNAPSGPSQPPDSPQSPAYQPPASTPDPSAYQNPASPSPYQDPTAFQYPAGPPAGPAYPYPPGPDPTAAYQASGTPDPAYQYADPAAYQTPPGYPAATGYPAQAYPPGYGFPAAPPQNGMAVASLVVSIVGVLGLCGYGLGGYLGIVGAILGHVAKRQIRERGESGGGMATAGIIIGWITTAIAVIATALIIIFAVYVTQNPDEFTSSY
ncbi:DUF4190 domain-containing protein [Micromonospora sp. NBC_01796]|uniref:DUF4190 domain-containing protein n=1 Tax=Micromonospora sp. NBC_01796 TaxID=2975987 RepID=UPI002DDC7850|nr:DUF4190 domain-containing protein [Micromonospora sp. NBC_01796]WSA89121.1 DUF4190 domain-containing protein [Micromonospora sp. NBC_01796]